MDRQTARYGNQSAEGIGGLGIISTRIRVETVMLNSHCDNNDKKIN